MKDVRDFLDMYIPTPLSRTGQLQIRDCKTNDLQAAISVLERHGSLGTAERLKALRRQMNKYGVIRPVHLPYIVLEKMK